MDIILLWEQHIHWIALVSLLSVIGALFYMGLNRIRHKRIEEHFQQVKELIRTVNPEKRLEENLDRLLEMIAYLVKAPTYTFYVMNKKNQNYILKAVRYQSQEFGEVRPSYSGLVSFQEGTYMPSISLPVSRRVYEIKKKSEGEIPLFFIPVGEQGLILVGPLEHIRKKHFRMIEALTKQMEYVLHSLIVTEDIRSQADVVVASGRALQKISNISMDWKMMMEMIIKLCIQSVKASGGFCVQKAGEGYQIVTQVGLDKTMLSALKDDADTLGTFNASVKSENIQYIKRSDKIYYSLPSYIAAAGMESLLINRLGEYNESCFVLWFEDEQDDVEEKEKKVIMGIMMEHVRTVIGYQTGLRKFSNAYLDILKLLARLLDNISPYTVGYSEMMSRYSVTIARRLELEEEVVKDIALAAYLSNIGVLGLSSTLFEKEGKYSEEEYELMKLHAEVGASIVNVATGNDRIASYIMHHHERIDGYGYPSGLKEEEIPVGSRIIAVVQTFIAKICGRKYRDPLPFDKALELLRSSAGSQLDENIVEVFCQWYTEKRTNPAISGRPIGKCWEVLCVPKSICQNCPAYQSEENIPCWEVKNTLSRDHGKSCEKCIIRTEFMSR